jgi:peptidoglycan/xylan/chitin deacetylase (PgdA/CDA1 family)
MSVSTQGKEHYLLASKKWHNPTELHTKLKVSYPGGKKFAALFTHDVDEVTWSWRRRLLMNLLHPIAVRRSRDPYMSFDKMLAFEDEMGIKSTFFFMTKRRRREDGPYNISDLREVLDKIASADCEIGLHGTYDSYNRLEYLREEKRVLEGMVDGEIYGIRQHYLRFSYPDSWKIQEDTGFLYDSTVSDPSREGFAVGYCYPYKPQGYNIWEVPLTIMDCTLFSKKYRGYSIEQAKKVCLKLLDVVEDANGVMVLNWHNTQWDKLTYPGSLMFYKWFVKKILERNPYVDTMKEFVLWWNENVEG